jgi:hypothetical protein
MLMPEDKYWLSYSSRFKVLPSRLKVPEIQPDLCVCIPVYAEADLIITLNSLVQCQLPPVHVEVLLLFNEDNRMTQDDKEVHDRVWKEVNDWIGNSHQQNAGLRFLPIRVTEMPDPGGGVGWARKLVMDEAARRLGRSGIILCLDADCVVAENYLNAVWNYFAQHPSCNAGTIYFEHSIDSLSGKTRSHIIQYELHLRYLVNALKWTGHPFAFHTVGSAMACRREAYLAQGGMNTRQAGEDFYFLQKFAETGTLQEIHSTVIYPSARQSSRVPFGTGRAMHQLDTGDAFWTTTSFSSFEEIKPLFQHVHALRLWAIQNKDEKSFVKCSSTMGMSQRVIDYLLAGDFLEKSIEIANHTSTEDAFAKRFFRYFNAFRMIKYTHYMKDVFYPDVPVFEASAKLASELKLPILSSPGIEELLTIFRQLDKKALMSRSDEGSR